MVDCVACVSFILVLNSIAEGIGSPGEFPIEDLGPILRIGNGGRVVRQGARRSVYADQAVLASDLPMIGLRGRMVFNSGEESLRSRSVADGANGFSDRDEVLRS